MSKLILVVTIIILAVLFAPMVFLWVINSLSEAGGSTFYIDHKPWNYLVAFIALLLLNASGST